MKRIARWLDRFLRVQCERDVAPLVFLPRRDDLSTLESLAALLGALAPRSPLAAKGLTAVSELRAMLDADRTLPRAAHPMLDTLVAGLEQGLA